MCISIKRFVYTYGRFMHVCMRVCVCACVGYKVSTNHCAAKGFACGVGGLWATRHFLNVVPNTEKAEMYTYVYNGSILAK